MDVAVDRDATGEIVIKLSAPDWEINISGQASEFLALSEIRTADWNQRRRIAAGTSAASQAWWSSDGTVASILVGHDDETWDMSVLVPLSSVDEIVREIRALSG